MLSNNPAETRALLGSRFKIMCADAGLSIDEAANFLHVTPRTIRYWFSGKTFVPFSAYKLLRIHCRYELPGEDWRGWHMHSGKLWTPEGHGFVPGDSSWWGLLVRKARLFGELYARHNALQHALNPSALDGIAVPPPSKGAGSTAPRLPTESEARRAGGALGVPTDAVGGDGEAGTPNLLLEHFSFYNVRLAGKKPALIGKSKKRSTQKKRLVVSHREKQEVAS